MNMYFISDKIVIIVSIIITILFLCILKNKKLEKTKIKALFCIYCNFMIHMCVLYYAQSLFYLPYLIMGVSITFGIINIIILKILHVYNQKMGTFFVMFTILVIQLSYITYTSFSTRQHDSREFVNYQKGGHFGYIGYIFFNNALPNGSPKDYWCFYNPPLFYIISVIFLKIQDFFGIVVESAGFENLQLLSVLYTMIFNVYVYKILKQMKIEKSILFMVAFVGLAPAMIIMSGSLNNDILSIMLSTMAIFYTIKWYNEDNLFNLIKIAFSISLAMMTKISTALVAVPIAIVFLIKLLKNKENFKRYIVNFIIFALIALPIGLWFPIKNLVLYDIPITYVQSVDQDNSSNISRFSSGQRLFNISKQNLETINVVMEGDNIDYNIFLTTIKSFIVDEKIEYENNMIMKISVYTIFYSSILLAILFFINFIYIIRRYKQINNHWISFFVLLFILNVISYIKFCFDYPFTFTMNFRYIVSTLISYGVITGTACEKNKNLFYINNIIISIFCIASVILFMNLK